MPKTRLYLSTVKGVADGRPYDWEMKLYLCEEHAIDRLIDGTPTDNPCVGCEHDEREIRASRSYKIDSNGVHYHTLFHQESTRRAAFGSALKRVQELLEIASDELGGTRPSIGTEAVLDALAVVDATLDHDRDRMGTKRSRSSVGVAPGVDRPI